jgi:transcriptional regulator with XRE-family HTH domain
VATDERAFNRAFGQRVRARREALRLSQEGLGVLVGLSRTSITNIEAGRQNVVAYTVRLFARHLDTSADDLLATNGPDATDLATVFPDIKRADERAFLGRALSKEAVAHGE